MKHNEAMISAGNFAGALLEQCERLMYVGSLRRGEPDVKNLDIVCISKPTGALGQNRVLDTLEQWAALEFVKPLTNSKGHNIAWGGNTKRAFSFYDTFYERWIPVNLYLSSPKTWAVMLILLSGEQPFTTALVTPKSKGGAMPANHIIRGWQVWNIPAGITVPKDGLPDEGEPMPTPTESDVFESLNLPYIPPFMRQETELQHWINFKPGGLTLSELWHVAYNRKAGLDVDKSGRWHYYGERIEPPAGVVFSNGAWYRNGVKISIPKREARIITARVDAGVTGSPGWVSIGTQPYELIFTPPRLNGERWSYSTKTLIAHAHEEIDRHERRTQDNKS